MIDLGDLILYSEKDLTSMFTVSTAASWLFVTQITVRMDSAHANVCV